MPSFPAPADLTVVLAHAAYRLGEEFASRGPPGRWIEARDLDGLRAAIGEADALVVSGLWRNELLAAAPRLKFIQSVSAGVDQYDRAMLARAGVRLASAQGVNERAVAEHALALILALTRQLHLARDRQARREWRPMIGDRARREEELAGATLLIVGLGRIGSRIARLAAAFDMRVLGVRRGGGALPGVEVIGPAGLRAALAAADHVVLACPLTPETTGLIGAAELAAMKPTARLVNVARGRVVDEAALLDALRAGRIAGAAIDCFEDEPLPAASPFWELPNAIVTPHSAGETRLYERNVIDLLVENLARLARGEAGLVNGVA